MRVDMRVDMRIGVGIDIRWSMRPPESSRRGGQKNKEDRHACTRAPGVAVGDADMALGFVTRRITDGRHAARHPHRGPI